MFAVSLLGAPAAAQVTQLGLHLSLKTVKNTTGDVIALRLAPPTTVADPAHYGDAVLRS